MLYLEGQDHDSRHLAVHQRPGGSVTAGMAIYDTMQFVSCDIVTIPMVSQHRWASSCSAPAPRKALRAAACPHYDGTSLGGVRGGGSDIAIQAEQLAYVKKLLAELIAVHTGQDVEQILLRRLRA